MQIFFGRIDPTICEYINNSYEVGDSKYEFCIEYGSNAGGVDEICIKDSIGRYIPINIDSLGGLQVAINRIIDINEEYKEMVELQESIDSPTYTEVSF